MIKKEIAQAMQKIRDSLESQQKFEWDHSIHNQISDITLDVNHIAVFASFRSEIDTYVLIESWLNQNKHVYLPRIQGKTMDFYEIVSLNDLEKNAMGILEPISNKAVNLEIIEMFIVPLLAFNKDNYRIGYGGGYYDRILSQTDAKKIGIAYNFQFVDVSFQEDYDVPMDFIVTNKEKEREYTTQS